MRIEKAIEILMLSRNCEFEADAQDLEDAHQLSIEALQLIQLIRASAGHPESANLRLPSETQEDA